LAKIAVELEQALARRREDGTEGRASPRVIARGDGWTVADVLCTHGPQDRPFEERHSAYTIAIVLTGTFQYRSPLGRELMTSGSLMLGNQEDCFECGHQHDHGDRCVSFWYAADYFERLTTDVGGRVGAVGFRVPRLPPLGPLSPLIASAGAAVAACIPWEDLVVTLAARTIKLTAGLSSNGKGLPLNAEARVTRVVRTIDRYPGDNHTLGNLAHQAGLSAYYFLRTFQGVTGITPHQYVLRARLREAASRLASDTDKVIDIALDCGFDDVSNFNRAFRAEFGMSPRQFRRVLSD